MTACVAAPVEVPRQPRHGEVESYSLILSLNELGEAFLTADEFLSVPPEDEPRTFTLEDMFGT